MAMIRYIDDELCHDFRYARIVAALSYCYPDVVVRSAAEDPTLRETNTAAVSGTADYRSLVLQMARKAPTLLHALLTRGLVCSGGGRMDPTRPCPGISASKRVGGQSS